MAKKALIVSVSVLLIVVVGLIFFHSKLGPDPQFVNPALNVINSLNVGDYQKATRDFTPALKARMTNEWLSPKWSQAIAMYGPLKECVVTRVTRGESESGPNSIYGVYITYKFERGPLYGIVKFDRQKQISQFSIWGLPQR